MFNVAYKELTPRQTLYWILKIQLFLGRVDDKWDLLASNGLRGVGEGDINFFPFVFIGVVAPYRVSCTFSVSTWNERILPLVFRFGAFWFGTTGLFLETLLLKLNLKAISLVIVGLVIFLLSLTCAKWDRYRLELTLKHNRSAEVWQTLELLFWYSDKYN